MAELGRRELLERAAAMAIPMVVPASAVGRGGRPAPSERLNVGVIGLGAMGRGHLGWFLAESSVQVMAVCEVDRIRREEGQRNTDAAYAEARGSGSYKGCAAYVDYRDMLARDDIDAVLIATPDHWHALMSADAAKAGKDVYCEKPITMNIAEGQRLIEIVRSYGCVFQTGTQYRSAPTIRRVCDFVRKGGLGKVKHAFTLWSKVEGLDTPISYALPAEPVPDWLDWPMWVGPAPWRPYNKRFHSNPIPGVVPWAFCEDFGVASITWHHSHSADVVQYGLGVERSGPVEIIHPSSGKYPTLTYRYENGTLLHLVYDWGQVKRDYKAVPDDARLDGNFGGVFVGEKGWVTSMTGGGPIEGGPPSIFEEMGMTNRQLTGGNNHHANWLDCIRTRGRTSTDEEIGHRTASVGHLAHIAFKLERSLKWDPVKEQFIGDEQANRLRSRAMREPWRI